MDITDSKERNCIGSLTEKEVLQNLSSSSSNNNNNNNNRSTTMGEQTKCLAYAVCFPSKMNSNNKKKIKEDCIFIPM